MLLTEISPQFHGTSWYPGRLRSRLPSRLFEGSIFRADIDIFQTDSYRTDDIFPTQQARLTWRIVPCLCTGSMMYYRNVNLYTMCTVANYTDTMQCQYLSIPYPIAGIMYWDCSMDSFTL